MATEGAKRKALLQGDVCLAVKYRACRDQDGLRGKAISRVLDVVPSTAPRRKKISTNLCALVVCVQPPRTRLATSSLRATSRHKPAQ